MKIATTIIIILFVNFSFSQEIERVKTLLLKDFPNSSTKDGRWVFIDSTKIERIESPIISNLIPEYQFYKTTFYNFLGYHVNESTCLILFNNKKSKVVLIEPMWYRDISKDFLKLLTNKKFKDENELKLLIKEIQTLLSIGSGYYFTEPTYTSETVIFKYEYPNRNKKSGVEIWRIIEVGLSKDKIHYFKSTNPHINKEVIIK